MGALEGLDETPPGREVLKAGAAHGAGCERASPARRRSFARAGTGRMS